MRTPITALMIIAMMTTGCSTHVQLVEIDEQMAFGYEYVGAFHEDHDPAALSPSLLMPYMDVTGCRRRVVERAAGAGATHIVWLYDTGVSAAAMAYRCPELCGELPVVTELKIETIAPAAVTGFLFLW